MTFLAESTGEEDGHARCAFPLRRRWIGWIRSCSCHGPVFGVVGRTGRRAEVRQILIHGAQYAVLLGTTILCLILHGRRYGFLKLLIIVFGLICAPFTKSALRSSVRFDGGCGGEMGRRRLARDEGAEEVPCMPSVAHSVILPSGDLLWALDGGLEGARLFGCCHWESPGAVTSGPWTVKPIEEV